MRIEIKNNKCTHYINPNHIVYCKAERMYSNIYTLDRKCIVLSYPLTILESLLPSTIFCRIHRSYILNISYLSHIKNIKNKEYAVVNESTEIPIAKSKKALLKEMLLSHDENTTSDNNSISFGK